MARIEKKARRPITRKFWTYLRFLPNWLQARIIRSKFGVDYDLPEGLIFRQAETEDEIRQALKLVHDSYVELNYMDRTESELRFSAFQALPTTVILIAKWEDEVIGTISIVPDSGLGLPSDSTWDLSKYRKKGKLIAEITSLAIKKSFRMRRGKLLLPLCKIMFLYCEKVFKLDGIVIATTLEVEPFYLHVLMFEKVVAKTGQRHSMVKGNPSTCCFLALNEELKETYKKVYNHLGLNRNLYHYFVVENTKNIHLPNQKSALQAYNHEKNIANSNIMKGDPSLTRDFKLEERQVLNNLHVNKAGLPPSLQDVGDFEKSRAEARFDVRFRAWCFFRTDVQPTEAHLIDVSGNGFRVNLRNTDRHTQLGERLVMVLEFQGQIIHCSAVVKWIKLETRLGCELSDSLMEWQHIMAAIHSEIHQELPLPSKKAA